MCHRTITYQTLRNESSEALKRTLPPESAQQHEFTSAECASILTVRLSAIKSYTVSYTYECLNISLVTRRTHEFTATTSYKFLSVC
jgi:hypothetical protein